MSELALVCGCIHQFDMYRPWSEMQYEMTPTAIASVIYVFAARLKCASDLYCDDDTNHDALGSLGNPIGGKFAYPVGKRRTRENVEALRSAEDNLDKVWRKFDEDLMAKARQLWNKAKGALEAAGKPALPAHDLTDNPLTKAVTRVLMQDRTLQRTPAWTEPETDMTKPFVTELYVPFSQLSFNDANSDEQTLRKNFSHQPKSKIKTHKPGNATMLAPEAEIATPVDGSETEEKHFLNARALKVSKTLFFTPSATSTPGELAWTDFLYAMVSVGLIPEKLYGSVWQFSPDPARLSVKRNIVFHEPHGTNSKISYWIARRHGRRLNRAYGWDGSSFTLEEKSK